MLQSLPDWQPTHLISADRRSELAFTLAEPHPAGGQLPAEQSLTLVVGDDAEWDETQGSSCMTNAACVQWDPRQSSIHILSSIAGLPPIYIYQKPGIIAVASELRLLRAIVKLEVSVNPQAVVELFRVGYPLEHRTLFADVALMAAGHSFVVDVLGLAKLTRFWEPAEPQSDAVSSSFIDLQVEAFKQAVRKLQLSNSLLSLSGGLDTRAILAVLSEMGVQLTACTISGGRNLSLDARSALALSKAYGMPHVLVALDERFLKDLPVYVVEASRLSGGLASVEQAHEVFFYRQMEGIGSRLLSGNLGNQVGRRGVEAVSMRNAGLWVLDDTLRSNAGPESGEHWLVATTRRSGHTLLQVLLQYEVPFSSAGNYSIGNHFMIQQSPYASRELIEVGIGYLLQSSKSHVFFPRHARFRDLRHRFLGQPLAKSFQRKVISTVGGFAAEYPINWGWRAKGGVSLQGLAWGALALADAASSHPYLKSKFMQKFLHGVGAEGVHEFKQSRMWVDTILREFVNDSLRSRLVAESGLFDAAAVVRLLDEHYGHVRPHYSTLIAALDLALAQQLFA